VKDQPRAPGPYSAKLFVVSNSLTDHELLSKVGLEPDRQWTKGTVRDTRFPNAKYQISGLEYRTDVDENAPVSEHVGALLAKVRPVARRIAEVAKLAKPIDRSNAVPDPWVYIYLSMFAGPDDETVWLTNNYLTELAELGADLELSISIVNEEPE
jgi:Domain of unknown function (DUF4279)